MNKETWNWILNNFGNIFSVLGVIATLYFGFFYIPEYIEESQNEKIINASEEVIQSIKELVYSDSIVSVNEIITLIRSKEVSTNIIFKNSDEWFLLRAEESFMEDRFIPLKDRRNLLDELGFLIKELPNANKQHKTPKSSFKWVPSALSILVTLLGLILGFISARVKYLTQKIKDEEIENELKKAQSEIGATAMSVDYIKIENAILNILKNNNFELIQTSFNKTDREFDFEFLYGNSKYFVEVKVLRASKVGLKSIESFLYQLRSKKGIGIFIYNTDLTSLSVKRIIDFNKSNDYSKVYSIKFTSEKDVEKKINEIVKKTS